MRNDGGLQQGVKHRLRILHVFAPAPYGGLEQVVKGLAGEQAAAGHDVAIAGVVDRDGPPHRVLEALRGRGVEVHELRLPARAYRRERQWVAAVCDTFRPDVMHTHGYRADVLHGGVARGRGLLPVTTVHGFIGGSLKNRFYEWLQRRAYGRYGAVVAVSAPLASQLVADGVPADRVHCIPNAWVDDTEFMDRAGARERLGLYDGPWAGYVGRVGHEKGADVFVEAMARVGGEVHGVMVGDGRLREQLERRARAPELAGRVRLTGMIPEAGRYMRALDVFVLSSRTEGTPIALLEAVAAGVPVVATRVGGVPGVVSETEALLVEPERPAELAAAIDAVLADPGKARTRADRARQRILTEFDPARWVEQYNQVYRLTISEAGGS